MYKNIFEYVPNRYCVTDENLAMVDAIEINWDSQQNPAWGLVFLGEKFTPEIAQARGYQEGNWYTACVILQSR